jgi:hypothetical protein
MCSKTSSTSLDGAWTSRSRTGCIKEIMDLSASTESGLQVKTTDAYSVRLETANEYKEALVEQGKISKAASILIVVGREDTGALEAQVRGSRFAWDIRLISVERLMKLVQILEKSDDPATAIQIRQLLHPFEYTKVDKIIDVIFTAAADVESQQEEEKDEPETGTNTDTKPKQIYTAPALIDAKRQQAIDAFSRLRQIDLIKRSRTSFSTSDKQLRVCCTVSKRYDNDYQPYWYAYHPKWDTFLAEGQGFLVLCCMALASAFAVPQRWLAENKQNLNMTEKPDGRSYWHIPLTTLSDGSLAINLSKVGKKYSLEPHRFAL